MKESKKKVLDVIKVGLVKLLKIVWIVLKSFLKALTVDFYNNIKSYWMGRTDKDVKAQSAEKSEEPQP